MTVGILLLVILALSFDFLNGFHDSANSIATIVSTRVLSPRLAVLWAAFFNMIAFFYNWFMMEEGFSIERKIMIEIYFCT